MSVDLTPIWIVVITSLAATVVGPLVLAHQQRRAKEQDHEREDLVAARAAEVAEKAAEAAALLIEYNQAIARTAEDTRAQVARTAEMTNGKLDQIHTLVNSNMTAAMQNELDATIRELAVMRELVQLRQHAGAAPTAETLAAVDATQKKVDELKANLADRLVQTQKADFELRQAVDADVSPEPPTGYRRMEDGE